MMDLFAEEIPQFMQHSIQPHVPDWLKPLEQIVKDYYLNSAKGMPWIAPQTDALGVVVFATVVIHAVENYPIEHTTELKRITQKLSEISAALADVKEVPVTAYDTQLGSTEVP